ncbi:ATP-binding protein [Marinobacterium nitratireducens]|uniref:ATP-binding protein n=1 Tax=Marinobacterium nitratireducens TaxID=518897 RepID=A0A917Z8I1_9GAMM|nr:ATP-binding protein [Marinobacterium nitratireducens]GGO75838.1 ATP-binding protein [Marinobacterium nitratireducens]
MDTIDWTRTKAAVWRARNAHLREIRRLDPIGLDQLLGVERQKSLLCQNTERFLAGKPANNALLWGSRGTGKSSLIKALLNRYHDDGLRMIEVDKDDLVDLPDIVDDIRELPQYFVIFCDDLSFEEGESSYKPLKSVLEGSLELPPENVLIYASSNRRHLLPERMQDNDQARVHNTEIHFGDAIEEKISLSDRFGLWLSFYPISQPEYLTIVDHYFAAWEGDRKALHAEAIRFAQGRGVRSGRVARQFFNARS